MRHAPHAGDVLMFIELVAPQAQQPPDFAAIVTDALQKSLNPIGEVLKEEVEQRFETQTDPNGRPWRPLAEKTLIARARKTRANRILIVTAMLKNSFAYRVDRPNLRVTIATGGPAAIYAATHQFGRGNIPARPMLPTTGSVPQRLIDEAKGTVEDSLQREFSRFLGPRGQ